MFDESQLPTGPAFQGLFHVTAHGVGDERILRDNQDKSEFLACFRNHLVPEVTRNSSRHKYVKLHSKVSLVTFALIDNHYHLILRELAAGGMSSLMRRAQIRYAQYFNHRYKRRGPILDRAFEPTPISDLWHAKSAIAYVHLNNVVEQLDYEYTGHRLTLGQERRSWIDSETGLRLFGDVGDYTSFLNLVGPGIIDRKLVKHGMCRETYKYRPLT